MPQSRRQFFKVVAYGGLFSLGSEMAGAEDAPPRQGQRLAEALQMAGGVCQPLETVRVQSRSCGIISVRDAQGHEYVRQPVKTTFSFRVGGAIGNHTVMLQTEAGRLLDLATFPVNCQTELIDAEAEFHHLFNILHASMVGYDDAPCYARVLRIQQTGKFYHYFVPWLRDHVHTLKGLKYFYPELKSGIDLYADFQREDGLIWDNVDRRSPEKSIWDLRFADGGFIRAIDDSTIEFKRIPVENDVEYLFIEGLYYTWKATGDTDWMATRLDHALKALKYSTSDPYRWSKKYQLLKRGFTIDTWDFVSNEDIVGYIGKSNDAMIVNPLSTHFGIMFGDNTGMASSCRYLAEMLAYVDRHTEASQVRAIGAQLLDRINQLAWNGHFYTHHVAEDQTVERDFGVDQSQQISLSNAYSLNRDITHTQCVAIIQSYQALRQRIPSSSPGEWYTIYPPFPTGFDIPMWEYMNGGVTPIVAGELAHGAFEHGFEAYGVDILRRLHVLARQHRNFLYACYRGQQPEPPQRQFIPLDLRAIANIDFSDHPDGRVMGWTGEANNDLHEMPVGRQTFHDIPFDVIDPRTNHDRACLGLASFPSVGYGKWEEFKNNHRAQIGSSEPPGYLARASLTVNSTAVSIYFLHAMAGSFPAGTVTLHYQDETTYSEVIGAGKIGNWWTPADPPQNMGIPTTKVAWRGANQVCPNVGVYVYGMNHPYPEKRIQSLELESLKTGTKWLVLGITLSDRPVFFLPSPLSTGIPDNWSAAAVFSALIEGLAGIQDMGVAFDFAKLAPRWQATTTRQVQATAKYAASGGYLSYQYQWLPEQNQLALTFTGTAQTTQVEILLPNATPPRQTLLNGTAIVPVMQTVETSTYACFQVQGFGVHDIVITLG